MEQNKLRNFSIIAHIDHGKSTLADKLILATSALSQREMKDQVLDNMDLERERGITIKAQTVCLKHSSKEEGNFVFNMIDTPGHVDFTYEVSRSLAACEGVLLVIDATQGIQAQTIANLNLAMQHDLAVVPVINKIDLPSANPDFIKEQLEDVLQIDSDNAVLVSAKEGIGIDELMGSIKKLIPPPEGNASGRQRLAIACQLKGITKIASMIICGCNGQATIKNQFLFNRIQFLKDIFRIVFWIEERIGRSFPSDVQPKLTDKTVYFFLGLGQERLDLFRGANADNFAHGEYPFTLQTDIVVFPTTASAAGCDDFRLSELLPLELDIGMITGGWRYHVGDPRSRR